MNSTTSKRPNEISGWAVYCIFMLCALVLVLLVNVISADMTGTSHRTQLYQYNRQVSEHLRKDTWEDMAAIADCRSISFDAGDYAVMQRFADKYGIQQFHIRSLDYKATRDFPKMLSEIENYIKTNDIPMEKAKPAIDYILSQQTGDIGAASPTALCWDSSSGRTRPTTIPAPNHGAGIVVFFFRSRCYWG